MLPFKHQKIRILREMGRTVVGRQAALRLYPDTQAC